MVSSWPCDKWKLFWKVFFFKIVAVCSKTVFCASSNLISIPIAAIYFYKPVYVAPNAPTTTCFTLMPHILAISLIFLNLSYFPLIHQYICKYGKIYDLNFLLGSINEKCIWSSSFSLGITVDCKFQQNFVPFVLNNYVAQGRTTVELLESHVFRIISSEYICIHCHASFYIPFGPRSRTICETVSFSTLHILHRGDSPVLSIWNFT